MNRSVLLSIIAIAVALFVAACTGRAPIAGQGAGTGGASAGGTAGASPPGTGGAVAPGTGGVGTPGTGGAGMSGTGGAGTPATGGAGASGTGGAGTAGIGNVGGGGGTIAPGGSGGGVGGTGGATSNARGPCDIYRDAGQPCVAAYSTVRRLLSTYTGPLYQIRSGSSDQNTGSGGETHDIGQTIDGFADAAAVDAACAGTICTVSLLYDQSGKGSHLPVAKAGIQFGGPNATMDDFESSATGGSLLVGGHKVYALYMGARQGYRLARTGDGMPRSREPQGLYMLADGTRAGVGCCWEFGNGPPDAQTFYDSTALLLGGGAGSQVAAMLGAGAGPWFMADFGASIWAGGFQADGSAANPNNPSLSVKFGLGFLKTNLTAPTIGTTAWALRMADVTTATALTTAYQGAVPRPVFNAGAVILGVNSYNGNDSWGTFYEGAIVAGFPTDDAELAILRNVQAVGYGK